MTAGLCAGFTLALMLFSKFFPIISIWETEKEEEEREEEEIKRISSNRGKQPPG